MDLLTDMEINLLALMKSRLDPENSKLKSYIDGRIEELNYWIERIKLQQNDNSK